MQHKFTPTTHLKRAALTLLALILACATAWADNDPVSYIAANGSTQTCTDYTVLHTGDNVSNLPGGWYVVSENVEFNSQLYFSGSASIILCDGKTLTVNSGNYNSINVNYALTIYGQSGQSGTLNATCNSGTNSPCIYARNDITINGGIVSVNGEIGIRGPVITINRGTVTSTGNLIGIWATNNVIINGGKVRATGDSYGVMANNNITLGWTNYSDFINANSYYAVDGSVAIATGKTLYDDATAYSGTLTSDQIQAIVGQTLCPYSTNDFTVNTDSTEYTIHTATGWDVFCDALQDNNTWNHFSGKTVKLGADISITQSAGSAGNEFMGTFDGDGKTLTVDITETTTQGTAPFREIKGATIQNLVVTGSVVGTIHAAGLVGFARGADASTVNTITNCKVATNVTVTTPSGNNYHCGGVVGHAFHCTLNMSNTVYCGDITNSGNYVGGLQGWSDGNTINFSHCLFAGSYSGTTTGTALFHPVAVRYNNSATTADVSHVYYTATPTLTNSNYIAADGTKTTGRTTAPDNLGSQEVTYSFMGMTLYENGLFYNGLYYVAPTLSTDNSGAYLISSVDDWTNFCDMLYDNATWDRFIGKTVKLGANITVTQMAGGSNHAFTGTFDGNHKTLTLNYGTVQAPIDAEFVAPFVEVSGGAEFINLNIDGHIYAAYTGSSDPGVGGLIGHLFGGITIEGCTSTVEINSTTDRVGGFVGLCEQAVTFTNCKSSAVVTCTGSGSGFVGWSRDSNYTIAFYGCLFNGKILKKNGVGSGNGGFVGWKGYHKTVEITNCLVDPAAVAEGETMADDNSATFCRFSADTSLDNQATTITNCYYTETFGNAQGNQAHSISGGDYVTVGNAGTVSSEYTTSGLIFYNVGLKYGDVLYAAANDEVSLTLAHQDREGYDFIGYTATAGNLNGSSLTMPDGNVTINAEYTYTAPSELTVTDITFTTATLNWNGFQESYNVRYRTVGANEWQTIGGIAATTTTLSGLLSGTTYEWQVQGLDCNGEGGTTEWSEAGTFTTLSTCEVQPSELAATDITFTTATLNWNGLQESYSVRYRPAIVIFNEGFESGTMPDGWTRTGAYWQVTSGTGYAGYTGAATGNYNAGCYINNSNASDILITPVIDLGNVVSATLSFNFLNTAWAGDINILKVHYRVDEGEWHWLYTYENATGGWIPVTINLEGLAANYQIGFECENNYSYGMGIDDVKVIDNGAWTTENNVLNPFTLTGLTPETPYVWQVQGLDCNSEGSTTEWSEAGTFTTPNPCEAPSELTATDITATTATLNWNGLQESYNVRCHPAIVILNEGFESGTMPDGWTRTNEYWEVTSGTGFNYTGAATGNYNAGCYINNSNDSDTLITPVMDLSNVASATLSFNFWNTAWAGYINILKVYYRVDEGEWHWLYTNSNATVGWIPVTINLEGMAANYQIGFECESHWSYGMGIDDVKVTGINTSEWTTVTNVSSPHNLTGLTPETQYLWQVQGLDCYGEGSTTEWSEAGTFTTLPLPLPVSYIDENGQEQTLQPGEYTLLTGTETTLGAEGQETWCVVHSTLDYSQGIQLLGNTHIILCDGAAMNIGSSESPVSGSSYQEQVGFYGSGNNLSLYAQSGNTGALTIYSQSCSFDVKDLTIAGGNVNATKISNNYLVIGCTNNLTVCRSSLEIHANGQAVQAFNDVTLSNVTANIISPNGSGLVCSNFAVDNSQLTVTARNQAIQANVITLGCTAATDFIKATTTSSLTDSYYGTVKIADGQTLYAGTNAYTGTLTDAQRQAIGGQKLTNVAPPTYDYIGLDGTGATHTATVIDADYMPTSLSGWYIVQGTVNYTNTINLGGDTHIILADNAVMNVTASEGNYGIQSTSGSNSSLFVYGQTGQSGELNVTSNSFACFISGGDITIAGGKVTASGGIIGIYAQYTNNNGGNVTIKNATVTATGTSYFGILSEYGGNITIDNSNVTATSTGSSGIYAGNGNITIDNSNVTATSTGSSGINAENGNITIASGTVTASGSSTKFGIYTVYGSVTINGGQVTTTGSIGIYTVYGSVTINGGQVMATGNIYGIYAQNSSDNITLGWTNPTDYIYANKYDAGGTLSIAEGKTFIDEDGQTYSGTIAQADGAYPIDGKTLYPYSENAVPYLDENGQQRYCIAYTTLTGTETSLGTAGQETWYVVDSDVSFTDLTINGDIHLILVDGKTMNLNHEQGFVTLWGQANLTIYGQTNGTGTLSSLGLISAMNITINGGIINVKGDGFFKEENYIPAIWCVGDMVINGGKVYAQGDMGIVVASMGAKSDDMTTYNFTLNGGQVTAIGMSTDMGIIATGNITLGWTNPTDYIYANKYYTEGTLSIASCKTFVDENNTPYSGTIAQVDEAYAIDGKTLYPDCVVMKQVAGYEEGNGGWVFIASPVAESIAPSEVHNLFPSADETTDDYDLYHFNQAAELEWENWKATGNDPDFTTLVNGQGYLYATKNTKTLVFTGPFITDAESVAVGLEYDATDDHKCWNLVGNPFADTAYVDHDFYVMNALGSEIIAAEREYVNPMEGIFVKAEGEYDDTMIFSLQAPCKGQSSKPKHEQMVINLSRDRGPSTLRVASGTAGSGTTIIDRVIVRMGEGQTQPKFQINRNSTKLYIPQGGTDYAIITSNGQGELPLNFKAETDGTYTLSFNAEEVGFSYLHLIDNMTGADVDLLPLLRGQGGLNQPATYTFTAKTTDYESRFKLVFFRP